MAVGSLAVALAIFSVAYLPTNDGPQHVLSGFLQKAFSEPGTPYHALLEPLPEFAERGFSLLFVPLLEVFAWRLALRVTLVVIALSGAWAFAGLACALARQRSPWALLGFAFAFPWTLYMGFLPFVLAANVGVGIVAYAVHREEPRRTTFVILSMMLLGDAVLHVGAAVTTGLVVLAVFLLRAPTGRRLRALGVVALVGVPAAAVLAGVLLSSASSARPAGAVEPWSWTPLIDRLAELPRYAVPGPMPRALTGCAVVVCALVVGLRRAARREAARAEIAVLAMAMVFIACAIAGPIDLPGWQLVAPRFASLGVPLAVSLLVSCRPTRSPRLVLGAIVTLTAMSLALTYDFHRRLSRGCEPALAGLASEVDLSGFTLPVPLDAYCGVSSNPKTSEVPHLAPLFHVGALYAVARGGFTPYMFGGSSAIHAFRYRPGALESGGPPPPPPRLYLALVGAEGRTDQATREYLIARFAEYGLAHDHLLVVGARDGELASILARGYAADWQSHTAMIAHPRACVLDVLLDVDDARPVLVEIGGRPAGEVVFAMRPESGEVLPDGKRRLRFTKGACGPVWVRGFADVDGSGHASKGDIFCAGAGRDGSLEVDVTSHAEVRCRIEPPARGAPR